MPSGTMLKFSGLIMCTPKVAQEIFALEKETRIIILTAASANCREKDQRSKEMSRPKWPRAAC